MRNAKLIVVVCLFFISLITVSYGDVKAANNVETKAVAQSVNQNKYVKAEGGLIVRKEAHSKGAKVTMLKNGSKVFVYSTDSNGWSYIKQGEIKGYVKDSYLTSKNPNATNNSTSKRRVIDFSMNINQVKKMEPAKLINVRKGGNLTGLQYIVEKYGYSVLLEYYFADEKLKYIVYDFLPKKNSYNSWNEMVALFDILDEEAIKEFGYGTFVSDDYSHLSRVWEKDRYSVLLEVSDVDLYTSAKLIFYNH
ncbi:SH3 domain-containing protein [Bacillus ndiopicus]|uniref:SH3 domain-containing protein n=1 Tax=Bacillus ndiopicus TaxID=1347368 RepID=UPI0005AB832D|nr:SH3 domain-containing protein [Bacillus ndiopicus]